MAVKFTRAFGKPICVILYGVFGYLAAGITVIPLVALAALHLSEYFIFAVKVAKDCGINQFTAFVNCLAFGFTWWIPVKLDNSQNTK